MFPTVALLALVFSSLGYAQQPGTQLAETHPPLTVSTCSTGGSCSTKASSVVLDANWRWVHTTSGYTNCYTGNTWDASICPNPTTCATNCAVDGADYSGTYGITSSGNALTLKFVTQSSGKNIGSRVYLMASETEYQTFNLKNQEFTFDIDMSNLPCGLNGALYFSQMDADGGAARFPTNKAGAKFGTGYCDSQCPQDIKFINGAANLAGWTPSASDPNSGTGSFGTCCSEMDIWEANANAAAFTPHPCTVTAQTECSGAQCGDSGVCDHAGCDFNSFRMGNTTFLGSGAGHTIDTSQKFTVVTQFLTNDNTTSGTLTEIRRVYVQNGKVIQNSNTNVPGLKTYNSVTDQFCSDQKTVFGDTNTFAADGGLAAMGNAFQKGMVLVMSIWDDHAAEMLWLDSVYPVGANPSSPGVTRGGCPTNSGIPTNVESQSAGASVTFSNIKTGPIGSTFGH